MQGRLFEVVQDKWKEENENKAAQKGREILLIFEDLTFRLIQETDLDEQFGSHYPLPPRVMLLTKQWGFFPALFAQLKYSSDLLQGSCICVL